MARSALRLDDAIARYEKFAQREDEREKARNIAPEAGWNQSREILMRKIISDDRNYALKFSELMDLLDKAFWCGVDWEKQKGGQNGDEDRRGAGKEAARRDG